MSDYTKFREFFDANVVSCLQLIDDVEDTLFQINIKLTEIKSNILREKQYYPSLDLVIAGDNKKILDWNDIDKLTDARQHIIFKEYDKQKRQIYPEFYREHFHGDIESFYELRLEELYSDLWVNWNTAVLEANMHASMFIQAHEVKTKFQKQNVKQTIKSMILDAK